jgi:two-component system, OmpR family, KDP operon response regulator KdpE
MSPPPLRILVAEDDLAVRRLLHRILEAQGYAVSDAADGNSAWAAATADPAPDLVLLDLALPGRDGLSIVRDLRAKGSMLPIVVVSSHAEETNKVEALDLGADDYVTKPFGAPELLARIRTALRHRLQREGEIPLFRTGGLSVDLVRRTVTLAGKEVKLSPKEYDLLRLLAAHAGKVLTHRFIMHALWDGETDVQYLRFYIRSLRQKLGDAPANPRYILTEQGVGYRLRESGDLQGA